MLFASLLGTIVQIVLGLLVISVFAWFVYRHKNKMNTGGATVDAPAPKAKSRSAGPASESSKTAGAPTFPLEPAETFSTPLPDTEDDTNIDKSLDAGEFPVDVPETDIEAPQTVDEAIELTDEPIPLDDGIDQVLASAASLAPDSLPPKSAPTPPPQQPDTLPPVRSSQATPTNSSVQTPGSPSLGGGSIPPRRYKVGDAPGSGKAILPEPEDVLDEPSEIEVLSDSSTIGLSAFNPETSATSDRDEELAELRLALEASHNDLSHLTSQRDQAVSQVTRHEEELDRLRQAQQELNTAQEATQKEREKTKSLESELVDLREKLKESNVDSASAATIEELRVLLAQREAIEASLSRERDNLVAQNEELQRRLDNVDSPPADDKLANQFANLELQHQQAGAELSLANETVRQLNQNITQRDSELMSLRRQVNELRAELEKTAAVQAEKDQSVARELEQEHEAALAELQGKIDQSEASRRELSGRNAQLEQDLSQQDETAAANNNLSSELSLANETVRQLSQNVTQRDSELMSLKQHVQGLTARLEDANSSQAETDDLASRELQQQHEATVAELHAKIEKREAKIADLSSRNEQLEQDVSRQDQDTAASDMQMAELSLANETVRQLNQNMSQRDAELMSLRQNIQGLTAQLESAESTKAESSNSALQELEQQHEVAVTELREELKKRDAAFENVKAKNEELENTVTALSSTEQQDFDPAELSLANETVRELNQSLVQRDAELIQMRRELRAVEDAPATEADSQDGASDQLQQELERAQATCAELEAERNRQRDDFDTARENLLQEIAKAREELQTAVADLEVRQNQVNEQAMVIEKLRDDRSAGQQQIALLQSQATGVNTADVEKLTVERDDAIQRYDKLKIDFAHAVKDNEAGSDEEIQTLQKNLKEKASDFDALQAEHHTLKARFTAETEALRGRLETLSAELASVQRTNENDVDIDQPKVHAESLELTARIAELESSVEEQEQQAVSLLAEKQDLLDRLGAAQEDMDAKASQMRQMREQLQVAHQEAKEGTDLKQAFSDSQLAESELRKVADTQGSELKRLQEEQIELKQQLAHYIDAEEAWRHERVELLSQAGFDENGEPLEDDTTSTIDNSNQIQQLEATIEEREQALQALNGRFEELKRMYDSSDKSSVLHDDASDPVDILRSERDQAAASAASASATIAELMSELHKLKSAQSDTAELSKLEEENREYRRSVAELHASLNELEEFKLDRTREQETARQRLQEAARANAELNAELAELKRIANESEALDVDVAPNIESEAAAELAEEVSALKKQLNAAQRERTQQTKTISSLTTELDSIPSTAKVGAKAIRELKRLTSRLESQDKKLRGREDRLQDLAAELSKLRAETATLKNDLAEQQAISRASGTAVRAGATPPNGIASTRKTPTKKVAKKKTTASKNVARKKAATPKKKRATGSKAAETRKKSQATKSPEKDDLKKILGIGPALEKRLNARGIYRFDQVKAWSKSTIAELDEELALGGRIQRDKWIAQAKKLAQ